MLSILNFFEFSNLLILYFYDFIQEQTKSGQENSTKNLQLSCSSHLKIFSQQKLEWTWCTGQAAKEFLLFINDSILT